VLEVPISVSAAAAAVMLVLDPQIIIILIIIRKNVKTWPWKSKVSGSITMCLYSYTPYASQLKEWSSNFSTISREYRFNQKHLKSGAKSTIIQLVI
jgi:hypothetical protein